MAAGKIGNINAIRPAMKLFNDTDTLHTDKNLSRLGGRGVSQ